MNSFDNPDWNLAQAAAWVVYREEALIETLENAGAHEFGAIAIYKSLWPIDRKEYNKLSDLHKSFRKGNIVAWGYKNDTNYDLTAIPQNVWRDLDLSPPFAYLVKNRAQQYQPWTDIRVESAVIKNRWRSFHETSGRSKFNWKKIELIFKEIKKSNPKFSQNDLIDETQIKFEKKYLRDPPARSSFFNHIKDWS